MLTTISKTFDFDAAHRLDCLPPTHKCYQMHGHTYRVEVVLRGECGPPMFMFVDYADIADAWAPIHELLDHKTLNEVAGLGHPTTEAVADFILKRLERDGKIGVFLRTVRVYESSTTWCEVHKP